MIRPPCWKPFSTAMPMPSTVPPACATMSIRMVPDVGIAQNGVSKVDRLCYTYKGIVCKTGRRFYQAPNSLTTITIVSFFYAISHACRASRGGFTPP